MGGKNGGGGSGNAEAMMQMMQTMQSQQSVETPHMAATPQMPETPAALQMPEIITPTEIDWTEQNEQLAAKARADYKSDLASKKGRLDTVLTSPLLDDDETDVSQSLLTGS